jgi:hypothetical protein
VLQGYCVSIQENGVLLSVEQLTAIRKPYGLSDEFDDEQVKNGTRT